MAVGLVEPAGQKYPKTSHGPLHVLMFCVPVLPKYPAAQAFPVGLVEPAGHQNPFVRHAPLQKRVVCVPVLPK